MAGGQPRRERRYRAGRQRSPSCEKIKGEATERESHAGDLLFLLDVERRAATERLRVAIEEELMCAVCHSMVIEPRVVGCGHMFCKSCLEQWTALNKTCPMCSVGLKTVNFRKGGVRMYAINSIVEKVTDAMLPDVKERRKRAVEERQEERPCVKRRKRERGSADVSA